MKNFLVLNLAVLKVTGRPLKVNWHQHCTFSEAQTASSLMMT